MKHKKGIFESVRKPLAPPTKIFKNKREELLEDSIKMDYEYPICNICEEPMSRSINLTDQGEICWYCAKVE